VRSLVIVLVACQQSSPPAPAPGPTPAPTVAHTPFVIANKIVAEDGTVVRTLDNVPDGVQAIPTGPHRFEVDGLVVDTEADTVTKLTAPAALASVSIFGRHDHDEYELVRSEPDGRVRWKTPVSGVRSVRPPDIAVGSNRTAVALDSDVYVFDDATGKQAWRLGAAGDRLHIAGENLYSVRCNTPTHDHWLVGTAVASGALRFRISLDDDCDPWVAVDNDRIIVVEDHNPPSALIIDLAGNLLLRLDEEVEGSHREPWGGSHKIGDQLVLVTSKHVMALDAAGKVRWQRPTLHDTFVAANDVVALSGGDMIVANYGAISDSGVDLVRLRSDGSLVWHSCARALGVPHSQYAHLAYVEPRGDVLFVISQGASGAFLERLSLATGARELRCVMGEKCSQPTAGECPR
jgi:outer membrane protein assembly factor BamB